MKYLLKQNKEDKGILCDKVTIDGFDYYVDKSRLAKQNEKFLNEVTCPKEYLLKPIIATNNPNIDIPKVVDEVEKLAIEYEKNKFDGDLGMYPINIYKDGYNKSQETHPFSAENMTEFGKFCGEYGSQLTKDSNIWLNHFTDEEKSTTQLLQLWKEQQLKIVYYNE